MGLDIVVGASLVVYQPGHSIILIQVLWMSGQEFDGLGPERRYGFWRIKKVDVEPIGLVVILHVSEDIVIHITEELNLGFHPPVVLSVLKSGMPVKHSTVPPTHFVIARHARILYIVLLQDFGGFVKEFLADPRGHIPVLFGDSVIFAFCFRNFLCRLLEGVGKWDIVEKCPGVIKFVVPCGFQLFHGRDEFVKFFITDEREEGGIDAGGIKAVGFIVVVSVSP